MGLFMFLFEPQFLHPKCTCLMDWQEEKYGNVCKALAPRGTQSHTKPGPQWRSLSVIKGHKAAVAKLADVQTNDCSDLY